MLITKKTCKGMYDFPVSFCFILFILSSSLLTHCAQYYILFEGGERLS